MLTICAALLPSSWQPAVRSPQHARHHRRAPVLHASAALDRSPEGVGDIWQLTSALLQLEASPVDIATLTDAIDYPQGAGGQTNEPLAATADFLRRQRRSQLLTGLLQTDRPAYIETASFLNIPRKELPNRQDIPIRACDEAALRPDASPAATSESLVEGLNADGLVPDCDLADLPMGENLAEGALLEITRNIYSSETGVPRVPEKFERPPIAGMRAGWLIC